MEANPPVAGFLRRPVKLHGSSRKHRSSCLAVLPKVQVPDEGPLISRRLHYPQTCSGRRPWRLAGHADLRIAIFCSFTEARTAGAFLPKQHHRRYLRSRGAQRGLVA